MRIEFENITKNKLLDKRIKLNFLECVSHFSIMLLPLLLPALQGYSYLTKENPIQTLSTNTQLVLLLISLVIGYFKWKELVYYQLIVNRTDKQFESAVLATANKLKWVIYSLTDTKMEAIGHTGHSKNGQRIIIEKLPNKVLISSIISPGLFSGPDIFRANKKNIAVFFHYYSYSNKTIDLNEEVINQLEIEEVQIENASEWNLNNTLKRIITYIFSLGFVGFGVWIKSLGGPTFLTLIFVFLGLFNIVIDLYVIWTKRKKTSS